MQHNPQKLFHDIMIALNELEIFCNGKSFEDFDNDRGFQLIVERELEILGEALNRLRRDHTEEATDINDIDKIIGLRNIIAHGYDVIDQEILWDIVTNKIAILKRDIEKKIKE